MTAAIEAYRCACGVRMIKPHRTWRCRDCKQDMMKATGPEADLACARLLLVEIAAIHYRHGADCVESDSKGKLVVSRTSCRCGPLAKRVHDFLGTYTPDVPAVRDRELARR